MLFSPVFQNYLTIVSTSKHIRSNYPTIKRTGRNCQQEKNKIILFKAFRNALCLLSKQHEPKFKNSILFLEIF